MTKEKSVKIEENKEDRSLIMRLVNRGIVAETCDRESAIMEEIDELEGEVSEEKLNKLLSEFGEAVKLRKKLEKRYNELLEESIA